MDLTKTHGVIQASNRISNTGTMRRRGVLLAPLPHPTQPGDASASRLKKANEDSTAIEGLLHLKC